MPEQGERQSSLSAAEGSSALASDGRTDGRCLLCSAALGAAVFPYATRFGGQLYTYRHCANCASSTIDPLPSDKQLEAMYRQDDYHDEHYAELSHEVTSSRIRELLGLLPAGGRLLDFGCGNGQFLRLAAKLGFEAEGCELDARARDKAASNSGCPVLSVEEIESSGRRYSIIHLGDVLEHLPAPAAAMRRLEALLDPGGLLFVEGPLETNQSLVFGAAYSFGTARARIAGRSEGRLPPYHLFQTNARAQRAFFEQRLGYQVVRYDVWETGWPYRQEAPTGAGGRIKDLIARVAIGTATVLRPVGLELGNRFSALLVPRAVEPKA